MIRRFFAIAIVMLCAASARAVTCSTYTLPAPLNFGTYSPLNASATSANSTFTLRCSPPGSVLLKLGPSSTTGTFTRQMQLGANRLPYNIYRDAGTSIVWGDGTGTTQFLTWTPPANNSNYSGTLYGLIPAGADLPPGTYTDTVQVSLEFGGGQNDQQDISIQAVIAADCTVSAFTMDFGTYDPLVANKVTALDSTATVNVYCTKTTPATVQLGLGSNSSGTTRRMTDGAGAFLNYEIYRDSGRTTIWNTVNTNGATSSSRTTPLGGGFVAYGRIPGAQDAAVGSYTDNIQATVNY